MDSALFEHDPQELKIWLDALPRSSRSPDARGPENEELGDEKDAVVAILDKAVRECIKVPWHYLEASMLLYSISSSSRQEDGKEMDGTLEGYSPSSAASPLLMALLEIFATMIRGQLKAPSSSALSVATYLRQVVLGVCIKQPDSQYALRVVAKLESIMETANHESHTRSILKAISREIKILREAILSMDNLPIVVDMDASEDKSVSLFLEQIEVLKPGENFQHYYYYFCLM